MKILIAGAGIGGLTAALCLQKAGHEVQLFEQSSSFSEVGAGLQCGANALKVIDWLGLLPALERLSVAPSRVDFCDGVSGDVLYSSKWGFEYKFKYGAPYLHVHRADLHALLVDAFKGQLELSSSVESYTEASDFVTLNMIDGRSFNGDCLVAADGVKSVLRNQLLGHTDANFTGNIAWRGVVPRNRLPDDFMDKIASNFMGQGKHMVIYYLRDQQLVNFVGVVEGQQWQFDSWTGKAPWQELKADFDGWHPTVQTLIDAMDKDECYRWALFNHAPFNNWSSKRVTLLGDAAHSTLPFMASGAAMAIEDGRVLQRALDQTGKVAEGLQMYQRNRMSRTAKIQRDSNKFGTLYHIQNRLALKLAFKALHVIAKRKESFLPGYDANEIELR